ncbi:hypothetical protein ZWY2020_024315 [Hordeum vulgare]|nr:hypothetical protein ZWY2020_024315 [Hordeum vulgare]
MEKVWVLAYGLPRGGRSAPRVGKLAHILKAICEPMGKLVTAYLASFEDDGPVRIEILLAPQRLMVCLDFLFRSPEDLLGPAPAASVPGVDCQDRDGGSSEESSFCEEDDVDIVVPPTACWASRFLCC